MKWILILALLCLPSSALAQVWSTVPDSTTDANQTGAVHPSGTRVAYYDFTDTTDSPILNTSSCNFAVAMLNANEDGAGGDATVYIRACEEGVASTTQCPKLLKDTDGDGIVNDLPLTGVDTTDLHAIAFAATWIFGNVTANTNDARLTVFCY